MSGKNEFFNSRARQSIQTERPQLPLVHFEGGHAQMPALRNNRYQIYIAFAEVPAKVLLLSRHCNVNRLMRWQGWHRVAVKSRIMGLPEEADSMKSA